MQKTVLITGASSGFGFGLVTAFLNIGWHVIATCRNAQARKQLFATQMAAYAERLTLASLDVTSIEERQMMGRLLTERFSSRLDCLINNAGTGIFGALEELSEAQILKQMDANFTGMALLTRELLPCVRATQGQIINFSSVMGYVGLPLSSMYCASKYAVEGFSECLFYELKPYGVRVSIVEPGGFKTNFLTNLEMGVDSGTPGSTYAIPTHNYLQMRQKMAKAKGKSIEPVIKAVMGLIRAKKPPMRIRCGMDAKVVYWLQRILPSRLREWLYSLAFRKVFTQNSEDSPPVPRLHNA